MHPDLPLWGTGGYEWQQNEDLRQPVPRITDPATDNDDVYLSDLAIPEQLSLHPHELTPERHYVISWNNRPAPDWSAADGNWGFSSVYRADLLEDLVQHEIAAGRKISPTRTGADHGARRALGPARHARPPRGARDRRCGPTTSGRARRQMIATLEAWVEGWTDFGNARGPLRRDGDRDGEYDHAQAAGIMDAWWEPMIRAMFDAGLGGRDVSTVSRQGFHNAPGSGGQRVPGRLLRPGPGRPRQGARQPDPLADLADLLRLDRRRRRRHLAACANALLASLAAIDARPRRARAERILFLPTAALSMHWVNRPTTQGLAMFPEPSGRSDAGGRHRRRGGARAASTGAVATLSGTIA